MYYIIVNPVSRSGQGLKIWEQLETYIRQQEIEYKVFYSKEVGHVIKIVRDLCTSLLIDDETSRIKMIILGGDGTFNEALQGIKDFDRVMLGYIPTGSSNDLARDLMIPKDPLTVFKQILACEEPYRMDLGCLTYDVSSWELSRQHQDEIVSRRYFAVSCGLGYDAAICEEALSSRIKDFMNRLGLGKLTYLGIALKQLLSTKRSACQMILDDTTKVLLPDFLFVACMIHQYEGGGFMFGPNADCHDGIFNICTAGNISTMKILRALPSATKGKQFQYEGIEPYQAKKVHLLTSQPFWVHTDGEVTMKSNSITITCEKDKIQLLI